MDITASTAIAANSRTATADRPRVTSDFETFLRMLTTQMQNQDPLNPIDSADYAVQLATFSGVEQQMQTNDLLRDLQGGFSMLGMSQLAGWVGHEARVAGPVWQDGAPVTLALRPPAGADTAILAVRDAAGGLVAREEMPPDAASYRWLGADATGDPLPTGRYTLSVEYLAGEQSMGERAVEHYARIEEVRGGASGTTVVLQGGIEVPAGAVTALRQAGTKTFF